MNNTLLQVKIRQRINKLASGDYDNIEPWQIVEAFNKVQLEWVRNQINGVNNTREGSEGSIKRIDDLQQLINTSDLVGTNNKLYYQSTGLPDDYLAFKRVLAKAKHPDCEELRSIRIDLVEQGNVPEYLRDTNLKPDWNWAESFCTMLGGHIRIYTDNNFSIESAWLEYYRKPRNIQIAGVVNPFSGKESIKESTCELKEDIIEILADQTAAQIGGDLELFHQMSRTAQQSAQNN